MSTCVCGPSFGSQEIQPHLEASSIFQEVLSFSVRTRPPRGPLHPLLPAEYALPDCTEEAAPSSMCSLERLSPPGCTEEAQGLSPHPLRQPRPQTRGLYQDTLGCPGTPRTMEGRSSVCRGKYMQYIRGISLV